MRTKLNQLVGKMLGLIPVINCTILLALLIISSLSSAFPQTTHHSPLSSSSSPNLEGKVQEAHLHKITSRSIISGNINTNSNTNSNRQSKSMLFNSGPQPSFAADLIELHHKIATGRSLTLKCVVNDLGNHHVSWFHQEKRILLANDNKTINWRDRVHVSTQANTIFFLHIDNITLADQVSISYCLSLFSFHYNSSTKLVVSLLSLSFLFFSFPLLLLLSYKVSRSVSLDTKHIEMNETFVLFY